MLRIVPVDRDIGLKLGISNYYERSLPVFIKPYVGYISTRQYTRINIDFYDVFEAVPSVTLLLIQAANGKSTRSKKDVYRKERKSNEYGKITSDFNWNSSILQACRRGQYHQRRIASQQVYGHANEEVFYRRTNSGSPECL